ncbi:hypothetical protein NBT05_05065 [Aquimarina sp. ERC-38]|uniref:glycosyltransferase family 32 protein n=1 Tax=Aquimarina sp. ERC-38 TaxID=2949996 RepID=UPI0022469972|nr:glycosyltransferase [Aquimarina sp. ERC-38]UZO81836.1 hypothetical protein NBT05_05065 [Aquimarina sp. ERC-38]
MVVKLDLSKHEPIPKVIHISWKTKDILQNQSPVILNGLINLKNLNPEYSFEISDDQDIEHYLKNQLGAWDYFKIKNKKIVEKVDLWRLLKIYNEGGVYVDIDRYCNIPFDQIIKKETRCILPTHGDIDFSQDLIISCKHNLLYKTAIKDNLKARFFINPRGVFHLGPPLYMKTVTKVVFGKANRRRPGKEVMESYRKALQDSPYFQTYKEDLPNNSLIFKYDKNTFQLGNGMNKVEFYQSQNIVPWNRGKDKNTLILILFIIGVTIFLFLFL